MYSVFGGLLLLAIFIVALPYVWLIAKRLRPASAGIIVLRFVFVASLGFAVGAGGQVLYATCFRSRLYEASDPLIDFFPFWPSLAMTVDPACGGRLTASVTSADFYMIWLAVAAITWGITATIVRSVHRMRWYGEMEARAMAALRATGQSLSGGGAVFAGGALYAFWMYSILKSMGETLGFRIEIFLRDLSLVTLAPLLLTLPILPTFVSRRRLTNFVSAIVAASIIGSAVAEATIFADERRFMSECQHRTGLYSRPRAWPNGGSSLVYVPGRGVHATD